MCLSATFVVVIDTQYIIAPDIPKVPSDTWAAEHVQRRKPGQDGITSSPPPSPSRRRCRFIVERRR